jgi:hypothetical protein
VAAVGDPIRPQAGLSEGAVATMRIETPAGTLLVMGEPEQDISGSVLHVAGVHTNGQTNNLLAAHSIGLANLLAIRRHS